MTSKDKAEILANKASYSYMTDSSCKTVANHILKAIPLIELLAVAESADKFQNEYTVMNGADLHRTLTNLRAKLPKGIEL